MLRYLQTTISILKHFSTVKMMLLGMMMTTPFAKGPWDGDLLMNRSALSYVVNHSIVVHYINCGNSGLYHESLNYFWLNSIIFTQLIHQESPTTESLTNQALLPIDGNQLTRHILLTYSLNPCTIEGVGY